MPENRIMNEITDRRLPEPIKPRALKRYRDGTGERGYISTDGRYLFLARDGGFVVLDARTREAVAGLRSLTEHRDRFCAPGGRVPWLVCDMDRGIARIAESKSEALEWARSHACAPLRRGSTVHYEGTSLYDYTFGHPGEDSNMCLTVVRADEAHSYGWDPVQEPWYPYPNLPHEAGPRALRVREERFG